MSNSQSIKRSSARGEVQRALWLLVGVTAALFAFSIAVGAFAYFANAHRINDIQQARLHSCQRTYKAFDEVFKPFFPKHVTPVERKFKKTVAHLRAQCDRQVKSSG